MNLSERLRWWQRAARSRGADLKKAEQQQARWDKIGEEWHKKWATAKKEKRAGNAMRAKRKAARAAKKSAFWHEQADDLHDGYEKAVKRRDEVKHHIELRKQQQSEPEGFTVPVKPWNTLRRPVCGWFVPILDEARDKGWRGYVVSGVRTAAQSIGLCRGMCGADSCPGRCAGATSNHNATTCDRPQGAVDVTDYYNLSAILRQMGNPIFNDLPIDRVHFSATGR